MKAPKPVSTEGVPVPVSEDSIIKIHKHPVVEWLELLWSIGGLFFGSGSSVRCSQSEKHEREDQGLEPEEMLLRKRLKLEGEVCRHRREIDDLKRSVEELRD